MIFYDKIKQYLFESSRGTISNIDYYAQYESKVQSQSSDFLKVDIQPIKPGLPGISSVPLRIGVGGITVELVPNALVMLAFDGADPSKPYVSSFRNEQIKSFKIKDQNNDSITMGNGTITLTDSSNDSVTIGNGSVVIKSNNTTVIDASVSALKLGLIGTFAVLVQGSIDGLGIPITNNPAASATIVKAG